MHQVFKPILFLILWFVNFVSDEKLNSEIEAKAKLEARLAEAERKYQVVSIDLRNAKQEISRLEADNSGLEDKVRDLKVFVYVHTCQY